MSNLDSEAFGPLLHGTARAWRLKLDARLKPMGFTQAKWRTLLHLSLASDPLTQAEIAALLGIEEPTLVTLLHRTIVVVKLFIWASEPIGSSRESMRRRPSFEASCSTVFRCQN
jgi:hypothetical protein